MLVLGALCVLLPLAASLEYCNMTKAANLLADSDLHKYVDLLQRFEGSWFWYAALENDDPGTSASIEACFFKIVDKTLSAEFVFRDECGTVTSTINRTFTSGGDHLILDNRNNYYFYCSRHLIASYRCLSEGTVDGSNSRYSIWATRETREADVKKELKMCLAKIKREDPSADFVERAYPVFPKHV